MSTSSFSCLTPHNPFCATFQIPDSVALFDSCAILPFSTVRAANFLLLLLLTCSPSCNFLPDLTWWTVVWGWQFCKGNLATHFCLSASSMVCSQLASNVDTNKRELHICCCGARNKPSSQFGPPRGSGLCENSKPQHQPDFGVENKPVLKLVSNYVFCNIVARAVPEGPGVSIF